MTTARKGQASATASKPRRSTTPPPGPAKAPTEPVSDDLTDDLSAAGDLIFGPSRRLTGATSSAKASEPASLDDHRPVKGLAENEVIDRTYLFDGDTYHRVCWCDPASEKDTYRMVHRQRKQDPDSGQVVITLVPVFDGALSCPERAVHVAIDPRTRTMKSEVTDESFLFLYQDNLGNSPRTTVVTDTELLETGTGKGKKNWMTRLGLSTIVRPNKHAAVLVLMRAIAFNTRKEGEATVRIIDQTGPVYIDGRLCYANAAGYIGPNGDRVEGMGYVIGPNGPVAGVRCRPWKDTEQYRDIEYPVTLPETKAGRLAGLNALTDLISGYSDRGVTGVLVGQLLAAPLSGAMVRGALRVACVTSIIGPSRSGKTAYDLLLFTSQTRNLFGEIDAELNVRCSAPGASGSTTAPGVYQHLAPFAGVRSLLDDVMKDQWSEKHQQAAHDTMFEKIVTYIVGGGAKQAQNPNGKVEAAPSKKLYQSACFTAECLAPVPNLLDDSTYNRVALVWWENSLRCSRSVYDKLKSQEHTLVRNDGMRVILDILLRNPDAIADGYALALTPLRDAGLDERVAKNYARCLAGLHILDLAYRENGKKSTHYLEDAIAPTIEIARRLESYGSNGGDQMARTDLAEATREALVHLLDDPKSVYISEPPEKMPKGMSAVPTEPQQLPYGFTPGDCGWIISIQPPGTQDPEASGRGAVTWTYKAAALHLGSLVENLGGNRRPHPYQYRVEMKGSQFQALHLKLNYISRQQGYRECTREERVTALIESGVLREVKSPATGSKIYQLDYLWLRTTTYADVVSAEAESNTEGDD